MNWNDRGTCILFGDGAGAVIARASETGRMEQLLFTDGSKGDCLTTVEEMTSKGNMQSFIEMNGQEVFRFAVKKVPECIELLLQKSQIEKDNIAYYFLHQANARIIKSVSERLHIPIEKFPTNLESYGNTSSASVPILLDEANKKGLLHNGDYIVMAGFGGGLSWGSILLRW